MSTVEQGQAHTLENVKYKKKQTQMPTQYIVLGMICYLNLHCVDVFSL